MANITAKYRTVILRILTWAVIGHGLLIIGSVLIEQTALKRAAIGPNSAIIGVPLLVGISLVYVGTSLRRQKWAAWVITLLLYGFTVTSNLIHLIIFRQDQVILSWLEIVRGIIVPTFLVAALVYYRKLYTIKSDVRSFTLSLRAVALVLSVALAYGIVGFLLLTGRDFHRELSIPQALHYTIDQFNFTTSTILIPFTRRAKLFVDTLSIISFGSVFYAFVALFQPLRAKLTDQTHNREVMTALLKHYHGNSEDFFKLWPHDKTYLFSAGLTAGMAYQLKSGVCLAVGDPVGEVSHHDEVMQRYIELCRVNDWLPAVVHTQPKFSEYYKKHGFLLQKIGEEAIVDIAHFTKEVAPKKYFRQITNKFEKQGYEFEVLTPPHNQAIIQRLRAISKEWLELPGRSERGFMMGYFSEAYMQQCTILVARDAAHTIQAFINQIPSYDSHEANFDLLRYAKSSPGNTNDYLLTNFLTYAHKQGFVRCNLGLCPLAGLSSNGDDERTVINSALQFLYSNGDRFYSFSGLQRFKAKYEPIWESRYIAYKGGIRSFTRTLNALNRAMKVSQHHLKG